MQGAVAQGGYTTASSWGEAFSAATIKLPIRSESLTHEYKKIRSAALLGDAAMSEADLGRIQVAGDIVVELDYNATDIVKYALGGSAAGVYTPTLALPMFHMEIDKGTKRWHFQSCKVNQLTISGSSDSEDPLLCTYNLIAYNVAFSDTAFPTLSLANPNRVTFDQLAYMRLGEIDDALAGGDTVPISSFELMINNNLKADDMDSGETTGVLEPLRNGFRIVTSKFGLARYNTAATTVLGFNDTRLQQAFSFQDGAEEVLIQLPQGKIMTMPEFQVGGPEILKADVELEWYRNDNNSAMGVSDHLEITIS